MTQSAAAVLAMIGVLALSMPGGTCSFWAGLGVDHHHHGERSGSGVLCLHFHAHHGDCDHGHDHDCHGAGCDHHGGEPVEPCQPSEEPALVAAQGLFKLDVQEALAADDFSPDWAKAPDFSLSSGASQFAARPILRRPDAPPPPAEVRLCRFLT